MRNVSKVFLGFSLFFLFSLVTMAHAEPVKTINMASLESMLEKHSGKVVVVNFFATWCPPCREEIPGLVELVKERSEDVVVIGLSVDETVAPLPSFMKKFNMNYEVVRADAEIQQLFKVRSIPHNVVFNKKGDIVANESGYVTKEQLSAFIDKL